MDRDELARCGLSTGGSVLVIARGFRREFSQEPSWRDGRGDERGVLRIIRDADRCINAVLVRNVSAASLGVLDQREQGYLRRRVRPEQLTAFDSQQIPDPRGSIFSYEGRPAFYNPALRPNPEYLAICVAAASVWGERFRRTFLATTFVAGRALEPADV